MQRTYCLTFLYFFVVISIIGLSTSLIHERQAFRSRVLLQEEDTFEYRLSMPGCDPTKDNCTSPDTLVEVESPPQPTSSQEDPAPSCTDEPPEGAVLTCSEYASYGLCDGLESGFCSESCGWCCQDIQVPGTTCEFIVSKSLCGNQNIIADKFCLKSCGLCEGPSTPSPPPPSLPPPESPTESASSIKAQEAEALLAFKQALSDDSELGSWTGNDACKSWEGITCDNGRVTEITLGDSDFTLGEDGYTDVDVSSAVNNANVAIPPEWSALKELSEIELGGVGVTGSLPSALSVCTALQVCFLVRNDLTGSLPVEWSTLTNLELINIYNNQIRSSIPEQFSEWNKIRWFQMNYNELTGTLPSKFSIFYALKTLNINDNELTGTLPPQYSTFSDLKRIQTSDNYFEGEVPIEYSIFSSAYMSIFPQRGDGLCAPDQSVLFDGSSDDLC